MSGTAWRYCPQCATALSFITQDEDGGPKERLRCAHCGFTHWNNPTPVLAAIVECSDQGGKVLLARNAAWAGRMFALITGFMEAGEITHFVSAMGTTGTITGVSRFLKEKNPAVRILGAQPAEGSRIPGIRKWPEAYQPKIYEPSRVDELIQVSQDDAEDMARRLAREEGLFVGISSAGACWVALQVAQRLENATIVFVVCDRGDRYLSTGVFPA